jgi:hypothetical protein
LLTDGGVGSGTIGVVSPLTWFIATGAVIMLGAVAGTAWDQQKDRSGGTATGSPGRGIRSETGEDG